MEVTRMTSLRNTFLSFANGSCEPNQWEPYFRDYDADAWDAEGDGVIQAHTDDGLEYSLVIVHWRKLGFLLQLSCRNLETNRPVSCKFSVSDCTGLSNFQEQDDLQYPKGCFLGSRDAWLAVEDFLKNPTQPSSRVEWVDDGKIDWPE